MKKIYLLILCVLLSGCFNQKLEVTYPSANYTMDYVGEEYCYMAYGCEIVKTENGYTFKYSEYQEPDFYPNPDKYGSVWLSLDESYITAKGSIDFVKDELKTYHDMKFYYVDKNQSIKFYENRSLKEEAPITKVFYSDKLNQVYFYYQKDNEIILNEVHQGVLKEIDRFAYSDEEFTFDSIKVYEDKFYYYYTSNKKQKYVYKDQSYEFNINDSIILLESGILYTEYGKSITPTASYYIDLDKNQTYELNEILFIDNPVTKGNTFLFIDKKDASNPRFCLGIMKDTLEIYDLKIEERISDVEYYFYNEHQIVIIMNYSDTYILTIPR